MLPAFRRLLLSSLRRPLIRRRNPRFMASKTLPDQAMGILEDADLLFPLSEDHRSPLAPSLKLKRLKKRASGASNSPPIDPLADLPEDQKSKDLEEDIDLDDGLDPLFSDPVCSGLPEENEFMVDRDGEGDGVGRKVGGSAKVKSAKKRLSWDGEEEEGSKKKKKKRKGKHDEDGNPKVSIREKNRLEKEREAYLEHIHAESQRLLRETRNASFKPVPVVQKPISSVLERIRNRKLEIMKRSSTTLQSDSFAYAGSSVEEIDQSSNLPHANSHGSDINRDTAMDCDAQVPGVGSNEACSVPSEDAMHNKPFDGNLKDAVLNTCNGLKFPCIRSRPDNAERSDDKLADDNLDDIFGDSSVPSLPTSSSQFDCANKSSSSSDEDSDKENTDPCKVVKMGPSPKGNLAKTFVDDEAEEEEDSDHDPMGSHENEEEELDDSEDNELLNDMIASGYEEAPIEHEKRNQLHQEWLELQDAAETDNLLQRLNCGLRRKEPSVLHDNEDDVASDEGSGDEILDNHIPTNVLHNYSKRAKEMIAHMFNDGNDGYVSSDDEEAEQVLIRQRVIQQYKEETSCLSPLEDKHSREVFGLIKKLNIAPESKRKGKTSTSTFNMITGGNMKSFSKPSFLGRAPSHSLPASHKKGSATVRAFIFGRDDSSSKSSVSASDNFSDLDKSKSQPSKTSAAKFTSSQSKLTGLKTKAEANTNSGASLFDILKNSSMDFGKTLGRKQINSNAVSETQAAYQFAAFKLGRKFSRLETRNSQLK